jgi:hypothetical protein
MCNRCFSGWGALYRIKGRKKKSRTSESKFKRF